MQSKSEKTSSVMGIVVSVLLHGIFFAGCLALDYTQPSAEVNQVPTEMNSTTDQVAAEKAKS